MIFQGGSRPPAPPPPPSLDPCIKNYHLIVLLFQADLRKYTQGHKAVIVPYNKAFDTLKKFRKKTKNKYVYDNEKEAQVIVNEKNCLQSSYDIWASTRENLSSGGCKQQRRRPACAYAQPDQRLFYSLIGKYHI